MTSDGGMISILCMGKGNRLSSRDRDFFRLVSQYVFCNPFDPDANTFVHKIVGKNYKSRETLYRHLGEKVQKRIESAILGKNLLWSDFSGEDQELVRVALLYDTYGLCQTEFDELITRQIDAGSIPCSVHFADHILTLLHNRAFGRDQCLRYFEYFYQLRRAWFFIHHGLIGTSPSMQRLRAQLWRSVFTSDTNWYERYLWDKMEDFSTFLIGETGTGKGTAASAIGRSGYIGFDEKNNRFSTSFVDNFIEINLSQFPESLIESELFGHQKGAFTGAVESHRGVFSLCSEYGSIFLDEIGDASVPVQIKLLKVIEERTFTPVGSHKKMHFSGRIIAATNKEIGELSENNASFRKDFYYRLCSNVINVPTLKQQLSEDPSTLSHLLSHTIEKIIGESPDELVSAIFEVISREIRPDYHWPGNVRELEQAVRCILLNKEHCREIEGWCSIKKDPLMKYLKETCVSAHELLTAYCSALYEEYGTYEKVAHITQLDPRTVKKYIHAHPAD